MNEKDIQNLNLQTQPMVNGDEEIETSTIAPARAGFTDPATGNFIPVALPATDITMNDGATVQSRAGQIPDILENLNAHIQTSNAHNWRMNPDTGEPEWFNPVLGGFEGIGRGDNGGDFNPSPAIRTYGVQVDLNNSNPYTAVSYIDNAVGMIGGSSMWDSMPIFRDIKPCLFNNGQVVGYLNPNNYGQWDTAYNTAQSITPPAGNPNITSGAMGDVMVEFPLAGWQIQTSGNVMTVRITNDPNAGAQGFRYYAHTRVNEGDRNHLYVGTYKGFILNNRLRSLSGRSPNVSITIGDLRTAARQNGTGYDQQMFYSITLLQILYLIRFKNLNSQAALGQGASGGAGSGLTGPLVTGTTNSRGLNWGTQNVANQVKCLGIEDLWGNVWERVDGCFIDANFNLLTAFQNFNNTGAGYTNRGATGATATISDWIRRVQGNSEMGFLIREGGGSETTFFSDWGDILASRLGIFGGSWATTVGIAGVSRFHWETAATVSAVVGGRLMFL